MNRKFVLLLAALAAFPAWAQDSRLDDAGRHYEAGHYAEAFVRYASLADEGHCEAARIARLMARHGRRLYDTPFQVPDSRLRAWQRLAGCAGPHEGR